MNVRGIRLSLIVLSWIFVFFIPKKSFLRFLPTTIFSSFVLLMETILGIKYKWWKVKGGGKAAYENALTFILGTYFIGNIFIFHLTYRKFSSYVLLNLLLDLILSYPLHYLFEHFQLYKLKKFKSYHLFLTAFAYSFFNYGFQLLLDRMKRKRFTSFN